jgi:hypothetical protein
MDERFGHTNWKNYVSDFDDFKRQATELGFRGGYMAEEIVWRTQLDWTPEKPYYSDIEAAKYASRAIVTHLSLGFTMIDNQMREPSDPLTLLPRNYVIRTLCTVLAGAEPTDLPVQITSSAQNIESYSFRLPNNDFLFALWTDGIAVSTDTSQSANLTIRTASAKTAIGIDTLNGFEQTLDTTYESGVVVVNNLQVKDYPVILRLTQYQPTIPGEQANPLRISILSPENRTYPTSNVSLTYITDKPVTGATYSLDSQQKMIIPQNTTLTGLAEGPHRITVFAVDELENEVASPTIYFSVDIPDAAQTTVTTSKEVIAAAIVVAVSASIGVATFVHRKRQR